MNDLTQVIILILLFGGAAIWKVIMKLLSSGTTVKTLTEAGKRAKPLIDALSGESLADLDKKLREATRAKPEDVEEEEPLIDDRTQWGHREEKPVAMSLPPSPLERERMSPFQKLQERLSQYVEQRVERIERPIRRREPVPPPPPAPAKPKPAAPKKHVHKPAAKRAPAAGDLLGRLRSHRSEALREAIVLREILGPPRALAGRPSFGPRGMVGGGPPVAPPPPPRPAREAAGTGESRGIVPERVRAMYEMGMLTRDQYEALCNYFASQ